MLQHRIRLLSVVSAVMLATFAPAVMAAGVPSMYIAQTNTTVANDSDISLPVHINPSGVPVDTVQVTATFPADKLTFVGLNKAGSPFDAIVPATPTAANGTITFGAADLSGSPITSDTLVASLVFRASTDSGAAAVTLTGSQALRDGKTISGLSTTGTTLTLTGSSTSSRAVGINAITASTITADSATIRWHTALASSSVVDFGQTNYYGMTLGSDDLVTNHSVALGAVLAGATKVHFKVTSVAANGQYQTSGDQTFTTQGYTVAIRVTNKAGKPISGASVQVSGLPAMKTDTDGVAILSNVGFGVQKVVVDGSAQSVLVKSGVGKQAAAIQHFTLISEQNSSMTWPILGGLVVVVVLAGVLLLIKRREPKKD
jgi:hypothetical protein